jgi:hypothetical protein
MSLFYFTQKTLERGGVHSDYPLFGLLGLLALSSGPIIPNKRDIELGVFQGKARDLSLEARENAARALAVSE